MSGPHTTGSEPSESTLSTIDVDLRQSIFDGSHIFAQITLSADEITSVQDPARYLTILSRYSYLPRVHEEVYQHFRSFLPPKFLADVFTQPGVGPTPQNKAVGGGGHNGDLAQHHEERGGGQASVWQKEHPNSGQYGEIWFAETKSGRKLDPRWPVGVLLDMGSTSSFAGGTGAGAGGAVPGGPRLSSRGAVATGGQSSSSSGTSKDESLVSTEDLEEAAVLGSGSLGTLFMQDPDFSSLSYDQILQLDSPLSPWELTVHFQPPRENKMRDSRGSMVTSGEYTTLGMTGPTPTFGAPGVGAGGVLDQQLGEGGSAPAGASAKNGERRSSLDGSRVNSGSPSRRGGGGGGLMLSGREVENSYLCALKQASFLLHGSSNAFMRIPHQAQTDLLRAAFRSDRPLFERCWSHIGFPKTLRGLKQVPIRFHFPPDALGNDRNLLTSAEIYHTGRRKLFEIFFRYSSSSMQTK